MVATAVRQGDVRAAGNPSCGSSSSPAGGVAENGAKPCLFPSFTRQWRARPPSVIIRGEMPSSFRHSLKPCTAAWSSTPQVKAVPVKSGLGRACCERSLRE